MGDDRGGNSPSAGSGEFQEKFAICLTEQQNNGYTKKYGNCTGRKPQSAVSALCCGRCKTELIHYRKKFGGNHLWKYESNSNHGWDLS